MSAFDFLKKYIVLILKEEKIDEINAKKEATKTTHKDWPDSYGVHRWTEVWQ